MRIKQLYIIFIFLVIVNPVFAIRNSGNDIRNLQTSGKFERLVTPVPSLEATAVFRYLKDITGEKILSGQMWVPWGIDELDYIENITGKSPAIRGIDFIHEKDNKMEVQNAIDWWNAGGIPTIMWHWGAPSTGDGYENSKESIDIQKCFIQGTAENTAFREELRMKANHLEVLRNANVPVLWRPFHEFNGDWFWWSKQGPEMFKKLWIEMFNYFVNERKLNNLIWILCYTDNPDIKWYPGDEYVDMIAADSYTKDSDPQVKMFGKIRDITGDNLSPVAYHECGMIPDPEECFKTGAMWSWWMLWHTTFLSQMDHDYLRKVYNHELVITLDEIPDLVKDYGKNEFENKFLAGRIIPFPELKTYTLGSRTKKGQIDIDDGKLILTSSGTDLWEKKDEGFFAFQQMEGDFDISVQVISLDAVHLYTKAGIMARVDLSGGSKHVFFQVFPDNQYRNNNPGGCEFQYRDNKSGETKAIYPDPELAGNNFNVDFPNTWIRLSRKGDFFRSYISSDNKTWHLYSRHKQKMPAKLLVGLAATSHDSNRFTKAEFSDLQITWK